MKKIFVTLLCLTMSFSLIGCEQTNKVQLDPKDPVVLHFSTYYNDTHLAEIQRMVREFNESVGSEKGIYVEIIASGSISETNKMLLDSANNEPGSIEFPDIFTGETRFSNTIAEHEENVKLLGQWCTAHRAEGGKLCD